MYETKMVPQDENWRALIEYAHSNGGYTGRAPFPSLEAAEDNAVADRLERVFGEMNIASAAADNQEEQGYYYNKAGKTCANNVQVYNCWQLAHISQVKKSFYSSLKLD